MQGISCVKTIARAGYSWLREPSRAEKSAPVTKLSRSQPEPAFVNTSGSVVNRSFDSSATKHLPSSKAASVLPIPSSACSSQISVEL